MFGAGGEKVGSWAIRVFHILTFLEFRDAHFMRGDDSPQDYCDFFSEFLDNAYLPAQVLKVSPFRIKM